MNTEVRTQRTHGKWGIEIEKTSSGNQVQRRRYVRLDITSPIEFKLMVPSSEENPEAGLIPYTGEVLNVSGGGLLVESLEFLPEGGFTVLEFELNGTDRLTGIVGRIKRCEEVEESRYLVGVEFCTSDDIDQNCPAECKKLLAEHCMSFDEKVRNLINQYVFSRKVSEQSRESQK